MIPRVAIIHPWFPQYRKPFFEQLHKLSGASGIKLSIFHGDPPPEWVERGDSVQGTSATRLETRFIRSGHRSLVLKSLSKFQQCGPFDLVILEQAIRNLETYRILLSPRYRHRVAWWGHGRTYTARKSSSEERLKRALTLRGRWFFAYTPGGAEDVIQQGFPKAHVTTVNNSIDTTALQRDLATVDRRMVDRFVSENQLTGSTALYIGGLDASKRIDFLLEASSRVHNMRPQFRLLIVGDGELRHTVRKFAREHAWCHAVGPLFGMDKAVAMKASQVLSMPGRVGLTAVDSFAAGLPIVTTNWPFHAPEFEYLRSGITSIVAEDNVAAYADQLALVLSNGKLRQALSQASAESVAAYSIEAMSDRFFAGIQGALSLVGPT